MSRVRSQVEQIADSPLTLESRFVPSGETAVCGDSASDTLLYVSAGSGTLGVGDETYELVLGSAGLILAGEEATLEGHADGIAVVVATIGPNVDLHAPLGRRETVVSLGETGAQRATGARSFQILFGPHNGSTRATLFAGFIPPGKAPWHYHLYDEIVWVPQGPGRLHIGETTEVLEAGSAFRLRPRDVHIVENTSADHELTIIGIFTPAGSPSAAYLTSDVAAEYRFSG